MKRFTKTIGWLGMAAMLFVLPSCKDYLDRQNQSTVSPTDAFKNFVNFQGFVEELYYCIPESSKFYWQSSFNWGEDEIIVAGATWFYGYKIDNGDFWGWQRENDGWGSGWMDGPGNTLDQTNRFNKRFWPLAWYGIRKANMGLESIDRLTDATPEEKNLIRGQLLFFRAWFHFQLMSYFGGLPYIDKVLPADQKLDMPRLTYQATALRAAEDFKA
ncbi:MAG: RagB/SusD family nutrient uptake outer membrane protein, partial [Cytophagaceae bacterium]